jgi:hypothetical protein
MKHIKPFGDYSHGIYEGDWFDNLSYHPANQPDGPDPVREIDYIPAQQKFTVMSFMEDATGFALLYGKDSIGGGAWVLNTEDIPDDYLLVTTYDDDDESEAEMDEDACINYATDLWEARDKAIENVGEGTEGWEDGKILCKIDVDLAEELISNMGSAIRKGVSGSILSVSGIKREISGAVYELSKLFEL